MFTFIQVVVGVTYAFVTSCKQNFEKNAKKPTGKFDSHLELVQANNSMKHKHNVQWFGKFYRINHLAKEVQPPLL